jgi:formylmethanofuran dehydrogenase subunit C
MANVIGGGTGRFLTDADGDVISITNRLAVETEQDDPFSTFVTYPNFEASTTATAISGGDGTDAGLNVDVTDAKEIFIQTDDANTSYIMVGSSAGTTVASGTAASRQGIKLNGGETLVLAIADFDDIFIDAEVSGQLVSIAYFK